VGYYLEVEGRMQVWGGLFPEEVTLTGEEMPFADIFLCETEQTSNGYPVWIWYP
jgi:hypothetical protein